MVRIYRPARWQLAVRIADTQERPLATLGKLVLVDREIETSRSRILVDGERADSVVLATVRIKRVNTVLRLQFTISCKTFILERNFQNDILGHHLRKRIGTVGA